MNRTQAFSRLGSVSIVSSVLLAACGGGSTTREPAMAATGTATASAPVTEKDFNNTSFDSKHSFMVDNKFLPLVPGTQFTLTGTAVTTKKGLHEVVATVTDVTKWVNDVRTIVLWDRDFQNGVLAEEELALFAQDDKGNVWLMGENPDVYDNGSVTADKTWLGGHLKAIPGVAMRNDPKPGTSSYLHGLAPNAGFIDQAEVVKANQQTCAPAGCFQGVLVANEFDPNQQPQDGHQIKYHAPGVGVVRVEFLGGAEAETLTLTKLTHLNDKDLAAARDRTLALDTLAYDLAPDVWLHTAVAQALPNP